MRENVVLAVEILGSITGMERGSSFVWGLERKDYRESKEKSRQ